jgi:predicted HicB family RNase H-like nuclease
METKSKSRLRKKSSSLADSYTPSKWSPVHKRTEIRFPSAEEHRLVFEAAERSGLSMNGWLVRVTKAAAERELGMESGA